MTSSGENCRLQIEITDTNRSVCNFMTKTLFARLTKVGFFDILTIWGKVYKQFTIVSPLNLVLSKHDLTKRLGRKVDLIMRKQKNNTEVELTNNVDEVSNVQMLPGMETQVLLGQGVTRGSKMIGYWQRHWGLYAMLILPMTFFFIFSYLPMVNILIAFTRNNIFLPVFEVIQRGGPGGTSGWVGMANFQHAFQHPQFMNAVRNTVMFSALDLLVGFPAPIILALLLNELKMERFKKITQTISYMPHFLSWVIIGGMAVRLFSASGQNPGAINAIIYNMSGSRIPFLTEPVSWAIVNIAFAVWRSLGWNTIIYLAAITNISPELYEAADMDGASRIRKMWHVTLPGIRPVIVTLLILAIGGVMGADLARYEAMGNPLVHTVSNVIPTFIFRWALQGNNFSLGAAMGIFQSVIGMFLILSGNFIVKKLGGNAFW